MTSTTIPSAATTGAAAPSERRLRGLCLIVGAALIGVLIEVGVLGFAWFPALTGLTYLAAAAVSRSRGTLWGAGRGAGRRNRTDPRVRAPVRSGRPSRAVGGQAGRREVVHVHRAARAVGGVRAASGPAALSW